MYVGSLRVLEVGNGQVDIRTSALTTYLLWGTVARVDQTNFDTARDRRIRRFGSPDG